MVRLDMSIQPMKLFVQNVKAEEAHFGNRYFLFNLIAIWIGMAIGGLLFVLIRRMSILVREEFSARHSYVCFRLDFTFFVVTKIFFTSFFFDPKLKFPIKTKMDIETTLDIEPNSLNLTLEFHPQEIYSFIYFFFLYTLPLVKTRRTRGFKLCATVLLWIFCLRSSMLTPRLGIVLRLFWSLLLSLISTISHQSFTSS